MNTHSNIPAAPASVRGFYINRTLAALAATVLTAVWMAAAQPAHANEPGIATAKVSYSDLNLQNEAGARVLYRRLQSAAERVCGSGEQHNRAWQQCYETALADAVRSVGAPKLLAVHGASGTGSAHSG
jgi:UrcA family protein